MQYIQGLRGIKIKSTLPRFVQILKTRILKLDNPGSVWHKAYLLLLKVNWYKMVIWEAFL